MIALRTAVIEHTTADHVHHDWLIEDPTLTNPRDPNARLWTARVAPPPSLWHRLKRFDLTPIAPHRRHYLTYQGPVPGDRGRVRRLAQGRCFAKRWTPGRIDMTLQTEHATINLQLTRMTDHHWVATVGRSSKSVAHIASSASQRS